MPIKKPSVQKGPTDQELAQRIVAGEAALFAVLMKRYNQRLYRIARGLGIPDIECDDLLQQTYIQAYLKLPQFRGESAFATWLTRILINQGLMFLRKKRPAISEQGQLEGLGLDAAEHIASPSPTPERELLRRELRSVIEHAIEQLPKDHRIVYVMREIEDMSIADISRSLGISESNVKVRLHRSRRLLQARLRDYVGPDLYEFGNARCDAIVHHVLRAVSVTL
ncbi:MAG: RNA polymerase sigma factor [Bacteroidota bacterium]|nr:RNA polymerase sigma factor [Bacteroidota bacterium]MDP4233200.1 RNA polymerase sigma factor [Bacteroidota bacterium]MDP4242181.1 RNA polymerase sigma factor [Bacteroidota bacterium]MDP4287832.1 RNA polymerase sigma factor [Bacteroidota bacterium]